MLNLTEKEKQAIVAKHRRRIKAECDRAGRRDPHFVEREREYLKAHPHLAEQKHCGLCPDTDDHPRRKVIMPNGIVLYSAWYERCDRTPEGKLRSETAFIRLRNREIAEERWLRSPEGRQWYQVA